MKCAASAGRRTVESSSKPPGTTPREAILVRQVQHGEEVNDEDSKALSLSFVTSLKACANKKDLYLGSRIHADICDSGLLEKNTYIGNTLVSMYAKCGAVFRAQQLINALPVRNVVSWNSLIAGYIQNRQGRRALGCFRRMRNDGLSPNLSTYACILKACAITQEVDVGEQMHGEIVSLGLLEKNVILGNALVDMYAKCGVFSKAHKVLAEIPIHDEVSWGALIAGYAQEGQDQEALDCFQQMRSEGLSPNVVTWSALIGGYAQQGLAKEALECFQWMQQEGVSPNAITFINVLNACSHSGLLDEGQMLFDNMRDRYCITPDNKHYTCMVDLFGRARLLDKAMRLVETMPLAEYPPVWFAVLGACQEWGNVKLATLAFERAIQLDEGNTAAYVLMTNVYAAVGMREA